MELAHLPYRKATYEDYVGVQALQRLGKKKWRKRVEDVVLCLTAAFYPDDVVLGGGNSRQLKELPPGCRLGDNDNAFAGGVRLWAHSPPTVRRAQATRKPARAAAKRSR
jgi:polyphosphate glucokinase